MSKNIVFCGVGGQGTVLASRLIAAAAMKEKKHVMTAETIGMAQRGGSVFSHMKIGEANSPLIGKGEADLIIGFEPGETVRQLPFLKKGGAVVTSIRPVQPVSAMIGRASYDSDAMIAYLKAHVDHLILVDADRALGEIGNPKVLNMVLLGAAMKTGAIGVDPADVEEAMRGRLPEKLWDVNVRALRYMQN
ncbi:MAG: indolepyruvate oxidoreductase subunit beta [Lachnospiraceae bacterium]|jgi:indolepyruvate ferredoxin oxidoreductase beta subunit|nr:indolepyruvate oxidoreductase subunit beta [Lachnospiraceae bacterium]MCI1328239.1 indolepyruvate oxidoreductase subunit beta [Lachnospiraceae bacterium]